MAEEYDNEMRGVLFQVPEDKRSDKGPIMRGSCQIEGVEYRMSVWGNTSKNGRRYWSIKFQVDEGRDEKVQTSKPSSGAKKSSQAPLKGEEDDNEIPF